MLRTVPPPSSRRVGDGDIPRGRIGGVPNPGRAMLRGGALLAERLGRSAFVDLLTLALLSVPALLPLAAPGYLQGSDAIDHPWRSLVLREALREGILFPRWGPDLFYGYGFPFFNFYSPVSFYAAVLVEAIAGVDLVDGTKVTFALDVLLSGIGAYLLARQVVGGRAAGLLAGVLYMYAPFNLSEVYVRSNLAGSTGLALLPFALVVFVRLCRQPGLAISASGAAVVAALILTHNVTSAVALGIAAAVVALSCWRAPSRRLLGYSALTLALGLAAAAFFWMPAVGEMGSVYTDRLYSGHNDFRRHFVDPLGSVDEELYLRGWWEPYQQTMWGPIDLHPVYPYGSPPYKLSLFQGLLMLLCLAAAASRRNLRAPLLSLLLVALLLFYLHTSWSRFVWETVPAIVLVGYPWRLTGAIGLCLSVVGSWAVLALAPRPRSLAIASIGLAAMISSLWMLPRDLAPFAGGAEVTREALVQHEYRERNRFGTWADSQMLPRSVQWENVAAGDVVTRYDQSFPPEGWVADIAYLPGGSRAWILAARRGQQWLQARVEVGEPTKLAFHTVYFPGWTAYVDGVRVPIEPSSWEEYEEGRRAALGVCQVWVPEGRHEVTLLFEDTEIRRWSKLLSVAGVVGIGLLFLAAIWRRGGGARTRGRSLGLLAVVAGAALGYLAYGSLLVPEAPAWTENRIVLDLVKEAERRELRIAVPEGARPDDHVHPRTFTIRGEERPVLYMHPPASAARRLWLPEGARLQFSMGLDPGVWERPGDGVEFQVEVRDGGSSAVVFSAYVDPRSRPSDRRWIEASADLGRFARREVELVLRTLPGESADFDWAGWAEPRVILR